MKKFTFYNGVLACALIFFTTNADQQVRYYSQFKQDEFVNTHFFKNKTNGVFLDIGAHDGVSYNNSVFFERNLNWRGICIEPMQDAFNRLVQNRHCACIKGCIANFNGAAQFFKIDSKYVNIQMLSGLVQKYDPKHVERLKHDLKTYGGEGHIVDVECYRLNDILKMHGINHIDYLSLDTEGGELEILESIDFSKVYIDVIDVENNYEDQKIRDLLERNGYQFVARIVCDEIYKKVK